ncbi:MAG TPA: hypothetical protein VKZ59_06720, partial [Acidobacteriota bacterium]|nr:hypothetical protein [Acidobacteriota bacterium]
TQLVVSNFLFQQQHVHVAFFEGNGQPLEAEIDGVAASEVEFDLLRGATKNLLLTSTEGIKTGYARIESNFPLLVTGLLRTLGSGGSLISEAEIQTGNARQQFAMTVEVSRSENLDTAVAFVNVSEEENDVEARFWNPATGITITNPDRVTLAPGEQRAVFLEELFASAEEIVDFLEVNEAFTTMVTFRSRKPLAVTAIRTIRGVAQSSLSVGSREIGFVPTFPQGEP